MNRDRPRRRVLRWYPPRWRRRYGDELVALLDDTHGPGRVPLWCSLGLVRAGVVEWRRELRLVGAAVPPLERVRWGSIVVLWAWAVMLVAGLEFANVSEGWRRAMPAAGRGLPTAGFAIVLVAAAGGALAVVAAMALWARPLVRFLRRGGWSAIKSHVIRSLMFTLLSGGLFAAMLAWSRHLNADQRDGGYLPYALLVGALALAGAACAFSWTATATAAVRRIKPEPHVLQRFGGLAIALAGLIVAVAAGTIVWWAAIAAHAPWFLAGTPQGTAGVVAPTGLVVADALIALAAAVAVVGARRVASGLRARS